MEGSARGAARGAGAPGEPDGVGQSDTARELEALDDAHLWHPFTPQSVYREEDPLLVVGGEGHYLIDAEGRRYLDGVASLWCNLLGHRRPEIDRAVRDQLDRIAHATLLGHASEPAVRLARRLADVAPPGLSRVFFSDDGSTAVEVALKMAFQYGRQREGSGAGRSGAGAGGGGSRTRFLRLEGAYHGDTLGAVSVGGIDLFHETFRPLLFETIAAPAPYRYPDPEGLDPEVRAERAADELERLVEAHAEELAAVILEPGFQGAAGILPVPPAYLRRAREVTERHDVLLILDEVAAGMGRTGRMFACEHAGVSPDLVCLAKGLTGGYLPLAATLATERIYEAFLGDPARGRTFFHGHTYTGNALGAAAAGAVLDLFEREDVLGALGARIERLGRVLADLEELPAVGDVRQVGLAAGVELVADRATGEPFPPSERIGMKVCRAARENGVFLRPLGDTIVLMPPLSVTLGELERLGRAVRAGIEEVTGRADALGTAAGSARGRVTG